MSGGDANRHQINQNKMYFIHKKKEIWNYV